MRPDRVLTGSQHRFDSGSKRPHIDAMGLRELVKYVFSRAPKNRDEFSEDADTHNLAAATLHEQAAHEHQQAAKEHHRAAQLHVRGRHGKAVEKGDEAASTGQRAASSGAQASGEETQAKQQNDLDSGRLYLGD